MNRYITKEKQAITVSTMPRKIYPHPFRALLLPKSVIREPEASGSSLEMQNFTLTLKPQNESLHFNKPLNDACVH